MTNHIIIINPFSINKNLLTETSSKNKVIKSKRLIFFKFKLINYNSKIWYKFSLFIKIIVKWLIKIF